MPESEDGRQNVEGAPQEDSEEYKQSFAALKDSMRQGRDIRKRERELKRLADQVAKNRITHADMVDILENFDGIVSDLNGKLDMLKASAKQKRDQLDDAKEDLKRATGELKEAREEGRSQLDALKERYGARVAELEKVHAQAKEERRAMQGQLDAAEGEDLTPVSVDIEALQRKVDALRTREREAKDAVDDLKAEMRRAVRDKKQECDDRETPLSAQVDRLKSEIRRLDAEIEVNREDQDTVLKRMKYCEDMRNNPDRADTMAADIEQAEADMRVMRMEIEALDVARAKSKAQSRRARTVVVLGSLAAIVVIVVVVALVLNFT